MSRLTRRTVQFDYKPLSREQRGWLRKLPLLCDHVGREGAKRLSHIHDGITLLHNIGALSHLQACKDSLNEFSPASSPDNMRVPNILRFKKQRLISDDMQLKSQDSS